MLGNALSRLKDRLAQPTGPVTSPEVATAQAYLKHHGTSKQLDHRTGRQTEVVLIDSAWTTRKGHFHDGLEQTLVRPDGTVRHRWSNVPQQQQFQDELPIPIREIGDSYLVALEALQNRDSWQYLWSADVTLIDATTGEPVTAPSDISSR